MPFTMNPIANMLLIALTFATFCLACVSAFRMSRRKEYSSMRLSILWAGGLGVWLVSPIYSILFSTIGQYGGRITSNNAVFWLNAFGFVLILAATFLSLLRSSSQQAEKSN